MGRKWTKSVVKLADKDKTRKPGPKINPPDCAGFRFACAAQSTMHIEICVVDCNKAGGQKESLDGGFIFVRRPKAEGSLLCLAISYGLFIPLSEASISPHRPNLVTQPVIFKLRLSKSNKSFYRGEKNRVAQRDQGVVFMADTLSIKAGSHD